LPGILALPALADALRGPWPRDWDVVLREPDGAAAHPIQVLRAALPGLIPACAPTLGVSVFGGGFRNGTLVRGGGRREKVDRIGGLSLNRTIAGSLAGLAAAGLLVAWSWRQ